MAVSLQIITFCVDILYDERISKRVRQRFLKNVVDDLEAGAGFLRPLKMLMKDLVEKSGKKHRIFAAFDEDLDSVIECFGLAQPFHRGEVQCCVCGCKITHENLERFYVTDNEALICCSKLKCRRKSLEELRQISS